MSGLWREIDDVLAREGRAALVTLLLVRGSAPREPGARMIVRPDGRFSGTIGGGALEWQALAEAQKRLDRHPQGWGGEIAQALGPDLGQCCGGHVTLLIEVFAAADRAWIAPLAAGHADQPVSTRARREARGLWRREIVPQASLSPALDAERSIILDGGLLHERFDEARTPLLLFGAGHVGRALVLALAPLPFAVRWLDPRPEAFPAALPANATAIALRDVGAEIAGATPGAFVLALSHSHALDLEIAAAALARPDIGYAGVIGSQTKAARFRNRLAALGLPPASQARLACPVGPRRLRSKHPAWIAAELAVELLSLREALAMPEAGSTIHHARR